MVDKKGKLLKSYLKEMVESKGMAHHQLNSYNYFITEGLQKTFNEIGSISVPLPTGEEVILKFGKVKLNKPQIREADGSTTYILPYEARLRNLTYASPLYVEITPVFEDVEHETELVKIGDMPVMVKSILCPLSKMSRQELLEVGEDPDDPGGYFIINGTERVLVLSEDLAPQRVTYMIEDGVVIARLNSDTGGFVQRHHFERKENGLIVVRFANILDKPVSIIDLIRSLGVKTDKDIISLIGAEEDEMEELFVNMYSSASSYEESLENIAKNMRIRQVEKREERILNVLDNYLLTYLGNTPESRLKKAELLAIITRNIIRLHLGKIMPEDIDHYGNKRIKLAGELIDQLVRSVIIGKWGLVSKLQFSYQKIMKRGRKISRLQNIIPADAFNNQIMRAMATGTWIGNKTGISQRLERTNFVRFMTHLRSIVSPLTPTQEHFEARELHPTKFGRVCAVRTPEGQNIGLRNFLGIAAEISVELKDEEKQRVFDAIKMMVSKYEA